MQWGACTTKFCGTCAGMNPYERAREARIASNRARLAALDLPGMASNFQDRHLSKPKKPTKPRGLAAKRKKVPHTPYLYFLSTSHSHIQTSKLETLCCASRMENSYSVVAQHSGRLHQLTLDHS